MNRCLALVFALLLTILSVSSACIAAPFEWTHFTLEPERSGDRLQAHFSDDSRGRGDHEWSTEFRPSQLVGLDIAGFHAAGGHTLRFAVIREAGRLDCSGTGGSSYASGDCRFTPDEGFAQLLAARGIGRPSREQAFTMMAIDVRRTLIDALAAARYPTPSIDDLVALTALGADDRYIAGLAHAGYRPERVDSLIQFKALGISPEWIAGLARIGYGRLPADDLVQFKALGITPEFISGFQRIGYQYLPADQLVQLKALGITSEFARSAIAPGTSLPDTDELVRLRTVGRRR